MENATDSETVRYHHRNALNHIDQMQKAADAKDYLRAKMHYNAAIVELDDVLRKSIDV